MTGKRKKYRILLLTNRDSDNVGDQVIEACDIALIETVMKNLAVEQSDYVIDSQAASLVSKAYLQTGEKRLLKKAERLIAASDLLIFGGAPLFNYQYQMFYERTAVTLELAQKHHVPVIFSAIGIEQYDEENEKCQRLKRTLNFDCVRQITTRDGIKELEKYKSREDLTIDRVCDPAVFARWTFRNFLEEKPEDQRKTVGIFVFRANGFTDNGIEFSREDSAALWKGLIREFEGRGWDYRLLTSGHFGDEAFLDYMVKEQGIDESRCVFHMNLPEELVQSISGLDAVVSCRLHPGIIAYSLDVPSVGIVWNPKVKYFYDCIGYPDRCMEACALDAGKTADRLAEAMSRKIEKDGDYLMSVYRYLFDGIKKTLNGIGKDAAPYELEELSGHMPAYNGTTEQEQKEKLERKFRRMYETLNQRAEQNRSLKQELKCWKEITAEYEMSYRTSGTDGNAGLAEHWETAVNGEMSMTASNAYECRLQEKIKNDGTEEFAQNLFTHSRKEFCGWRVRFRSVGVWFWYLEDGTFCQKDSYDRKIHRARKAFAPGEKIPVIPLPGISLVVADAVWKKPQ